MKRILFFTTLTLLFFLHNGMAQRSNVILMHIQSEEQTTNQQLETKVILPSEDVSTEKKTPNEASTILQAPPVSPIAVAGTNEAQKASRKAYLRKLLSISPRISYGVGFDRSVMNYNLPTLTPYIESAREKLNLQYSWIPWNKINLSPINTNREKELIKKGKMSATAGINLPVIFIDVEAGAGRFSNALLAFRDVFPPWKLFNKEETFRNLLLKRVSTPETQTAFTIKTGIELERVLPQRWQPNLDFGKIDMGLDGSFYYVLSYDDSYRVGLEAIDPNAQKRLEDLFEPVALIPHTVKEKAAQAIIGHVESSLPSYFWMPAMHGFGYSGKVYIDFGKRVRIAARYHREKTKGIQVTNSDWLFTGPTVKRSFFTVSLETQI